jgi:NAD(P)H-dependent FMN reductase
MKFTVVSGSTRANSQSNKVAGYVQRYLSDTLHEDTHLLNLATANLKYWDETFWSDYANFDPNWSLASSEIRSSDALVIVAPEWNGMIPPALKNFFHLATKGELANKPALIVGVSSGINGVYPITELRLNSCKNTFLCYIPQHVIVRDVTNVLNTDTPQSKIDKDIRERLEYSIKMLQVYANAFSVIRADPIIKNSPFLYGM